MHISHKIVAAGQMLVEKRCTKLMPLPPISPEENLRGSHQATVTDQKIL